MKRTLLFAFSIASVLSLSSCSGIQQTGGGGTTTGSSNLILTMTDTPPTNVSVLSSPTSVGSLVMEGVTNNTNGDALVKLGTVVAEVDLVRLQSDSVFLPAEGHAGPYAVVNGNYRALAPVITMNALTYFNQTGAAVKLDSLNDMCNDNTICVFATSGFFGGTQEFATGGTSPLPIAIGSGTLSASIDLNQNALIASPNGFLTIDFSQPNAASLVALPRAGLPSGTLELAEDFIGTVTSVTGNTITIQPTGSKLFGTPLPLIADANTSTRFDGCGTATADITCIKAGETVSVDAAVHADGTVTLLEVDKLSDTTGDELEGVIATIDATNQVFVIAVHNKLTAANSTDTTFQKIDLGNPVQIALGTGATFAVDTKGLPVPAANLSTFTGFSNLAPGQMVRVNVSSTGTSTTGTPYRQATVSSVTLRFSRLTGKAVNPTGALFNFDVTTIPTFFGLTANPQVQVFSGFTNFDGVSDLTGVSTNDSVSIRALYLPNSAPPFFAAKVRRHAP